MKEKVFNLLEKIDDIQNIVALNFKSIDTNKSINDMQRQFRQDPNSGAYILIHNFFNELIDTIYKETYEPIIDEICKIIIDKNLIYDEDLYTLVDYHILMDKDWAGQKPSIEEDIKPQIIPIIKKGYEDNVKTCIKIAITEYPLIKEIINHFRNEDLNMRKEQIHMHDEDYPPDTVRRNQQLKEYNNRATQLLHPGANYEDEYEDNDENDEEIKQLRRNRPY